MSIKTLYIIFQKKKKMTKYYSVNLFKYCKTGLFGTIPEIVYQNKFKFKILWMCIHITLIYYIYIICV